MAKRFIGKTVLITGASSGIGAALAKEFSREGAQMICVARRTDRLSSLMSEIVREGGHGLTCPCDVARDGDLEEVVRKGVEAFGGIDVVVANAGVAIVGLLENLSLGDYRAQFETNVFGTLRTIYAALPELKKSRGTLVLVGSVFGYIATPFNSPYNMTKFSIRALADALYHELAPHGVSVVLISPGFVDSEIRDPVDEGPNRGGILASIPPWVEMSPEQCAKKIVNATYKRKREQVITLHGKIFLFLKKYFDGILHRILNVKVAKKFFPNLKT